MVEQYDETLEAFRNCFKSDWGHNPPYYSLEVAQDYLSRRQARIEQNARNGQPWNTGLGPD